MTEAWGGAAVTALGAVEQPRPKTKSRKRKKKNTINYYGYDPSIYVFEGDPRLQPPPDWFGVNYHPSQPISNSWLEWSGADVEMFDISKNQAIPISEDSSLLQDSQKRRKHKKNSSPANSPKGETPEEEIASGGASSASIHHMTLHPHQPTRNEWSDWNMQIEEFTKVPTVAPAPPPPPQSSTAIPVVEIERSNVSSTSSSSSLLRPVIVPMETEDSVPVSKSKNKNDSTRLNMKLENETNNSNNNNGSNTDEKKRKEQQTNKQTDDKDDGNTKKDIEVRNNARLNRMRKTMYLNAIEQHIGHLEELIQALKSGQNSPLVELARDGDGVYGTARAHDHCTHPKRIKAKVFRDPPAKDGFNPDEARIRLKREIDEKFQVRRMQVLIEQDGMKRRDIAAQVIGEIQGSLTSLENLVTANILLMKSMDNRQHDLQQLLQLTEEQMQKLWQLFKQREQGFVKEKIKLAALNRILLTAARMLLYPEIAQTNHTLSSILNAKQISKLLFRVAAEDEFVDSTDPVDNLIDQMKQLLK